MSNCVQRATSAKSGQIGIFWKGPGRTRDLEYNIDELMIESDYPTSKIVKYIINPCFHAGVFIIACILFYTITVSVDKIL